MQIQLSPADNSPIYTQIVNQVRHLVASGRLNPGEELPPIRALAEQLLINPNTVARAYRELEVAGIVTKRGTAGTFVSANGAALNRSERLELLTERVDALVTEARQLDVPLDDVLDFARQRDATLYDGAPEEGDRRRKPEQAQETP
jgi:GntR family transcriptional regulator